MRYLEDPN